MAEESPSGWIMEPRPERVAVLRALQLGDLLCAVPALRALRRALPDSQIVLIGLPWAAEFVKRFRAYLDGFREFPGWPGLPERVPDQARLPGFLVEMQAERFDLVLQIHGSGVVTNPLAARLGGRATAGFCVSAADGPDRARFLPYPDRGLEVRRLLRLLAFLGAEPDGEHLEFPLTGADRQALRSLVAPDELRAGSYACIHPGASTPLRRWGAGRFAAVADALAARGLRIVLTGTAGEADLTRRVAGAMRAPALDLAGRTDLGALGALLAGAHLLVSNDTGVSHLAAALRVPSVIISTGTNPERWAPADAARHRVLCRPEGVAVEAVVAEADALGAARERRWPEGAIPGF
jgi:ADP-heptose:LPS heptosyltransferase